MKHETVIALNDAFAGHGISNHFVDVGKMVDIGSHGLSLADEGETE